MIIFIIFFQKGEQITRYELQVFDKTFKLINKVDNINLGVDGVNRDIFVKDNYLFRGVSRKNKFYFYKISIDKSEIMKSRPISLKGQKLLATKYIDGKYYVITINRSRELVRHVFDINTLELETKKNHSNKFIYEKLSYLINKDNLAQINEQYTSLHAASCKMKSYFQNGNFILTYQTASDNFAEIINLKDNSYKKTIFSNLSENRTSVVLDGKFYVAELTKKSLTLKTFELNTGKSVSVICATRKNGLTKINSTKLSAGSFDGFLNRHSFTKKDYSSFGMIANKSNDQTILTIGIPSYHTYYEQVPMQNGMTALVESTYKTKYRYDDIRLTYDESTFFEAWINAKGEIIPYQEEYDYQSRYFAVYRFLNVFNIRDRFSDFTLFDIDSSTYLGCYDNKLKQYNIYKIL